MKHLRELYENAFRSSERRRVEWDTAFHSKSYNLLLIERGSLRISFGTQVLKEPLSAFYTTEEISLSPEGPCDYLLVRLDPRAVYEITAGGDLFPGPYAAFSPERAYRMTAAMREMEAADEEALPELSRQAAALHILQSLGSEQCSSQPMPEPQIPLTHHRLRLYAAAMEYIAGHATEHPSQSAAAAALHITPQYLGRLLMETRGLSYKDCLLRAEAERRARYEEIIKEAPAEEEAAPGLPIRDAASITLPARGTIRRESLYTRLDPLHAMPNYWCSLINLGYAVDLRNLDMDSALTRVQREIGFTCGRICRITDLITAGEARGRSFYDFSAVFSLLDSLIAHGITPFLELGNKSFLIQETTTLSYTPVSPTDTREYYQQLLKILPDFARACINHYGQASFDSWYFEISYMYTDSEARERFGLVQYAAMFRRIYTLLRSFSPTCRIGGPGFNDWSDPAGIRQMVKLLTSGHVSPDFFSVYSYPMERDAGGSVFLSADPKKAVERIRLFADTVRRSCPDREIWITEFNSNLSSRSYLNDSVYQAAYIAQMILGMRDIRIAALGYYLLSDAPLRYLDSLDFLFGGWGLLSDRGLPKPSFHAYRMMAMLGHYLIRTGEHYLITANSRGSFRILLSRYQHPTEAFLVKNVEKEDLTAPEGVFENAGSDRYRIVIEQVLKGTYLVKEYRIGTLKADLFGAWREMEFLYPPNRQTLEELALKSALVPKGEVRRLGEGQPFLLETTLSETELVLITVDLYASHL